MNGAGDTAQMVRDALAYDGRLNAADLVVRVADGIVTLSGLVFSEAERQEAEEVARQVPGVARVVNEILVVPLASH
ncbi:MAG: BON domain-containing protein [Chloroflexi bacterium]|nr:BON domain-containing protein [Chloroflexota bacterium]HLG50490.1 BON domain-containing protein [Chloroflexota bacterium]